MTFPAFLLLVCPLFLFQHSEQGVNVRAEWQHWPYLAGCEAARLEAVAVAPKVPCVGWDAG